MYIAVHAVHHLDVIDLTVFIQVKVVDLFFFAVQFFFKLLQGLAFLEQL